MGKAAVSSGKRYVSLLLLSGVWLGAAVMTPTPAAAAGNTYHASPTGSGTTCSLAVPCEIEEAVVKAGDGDSISLAAGSYGLPLPGILVEKAIDFGGAPGAAAVLQTTGTAGLHVTDKADSHLHDLRLEGGGGLVLGSGAAERVFVAHQGARDDACELEKGTVLRDSVCWTVESNEEEEGVSHAVDISSSGENQDELVVLRNVTAVADTADGNAIHLLAAAAAELTVDAANVIARSANGTDVVAEVQPVFAKAHLNISNSSFGESASTPGADVTPLGVAGNIGAPAAFLDAVNGDFHVGGDSPTLDGGIADISAGILDLDGSDRAQPKCFGAAAIPDMGAYERTPTAACTPPPPPPPPPFEPRKPIFRIVNLFLNKKTGTGRLLVEVPGAGTLSLTGSGVKLVRRTAAAGGSVISLPIQTWAITKVRLAKLGKARVRLKVLFEARGGGVERWAKGVLLRRNVS